MIKITLKNGKEYEVLDSTLVYPSGMSSVRNKMEIHLDESSMTLTELEKIFTDEKATDEIRVTKTICTITIVLRLASARRLFLL